MKEAKGLKRLKSIEHSAEGIGTVWREIIIDKIGKGEETAALRENKFGGSKTLEYGRS